MTRIEKLGIDLTTENGFKQAIDLKCIDIDGKTRCFDCEVFAGTHACINKLAEKLFEEVPTKKVKRWETYNGDFLKARGEWKDTECVIKQDGLHCPSCRFRESKSIHDCFAKWLMEEIEVAE